MRALAPGLYHFAEQGKSLHVAVTDTDDGRLTVVLDATEAEERVYRFGFTLCALWLGCVAGTIWIARGVAAFAVGPIVAATRTIASSAPGQPLPTTGRNDEAGVLMETFNRFRDRVDDMVEREREFAANLDHEIRTPLTTIRTDAELVGLEATSNRRSAAAWSGSPPPSTRSSPPPNRRSRTAPAASSATRRSTCASSCSTPPPR